MERDQLFRILPGIMKTVESLVWRSQSVVLPEPTWPLDLRAIKLSSLIQIFKLVEKSRVFKCAIMCIRQKQKTKTRSGVVAQPVMPAPRRPR